MNQEEKTLTSMANLKSYIYNKYNYKVNKKKYNQLNNFQKSLIFLKEELKDYEKIETINEKINELIHALIYEEFTTTKAKGE